MHASRTFRSLRLRWLWLAAWSLMIAAVVALSLVPGLAIPPWLAIDKLDHVVAYFALAAFAVQIYACRHVQSVAAVSLIVLGIALELAQGYLTADRDMSLADAWLATLGVAAGFATSWTPLARVLQRVEAKIAR